MDNKEVDEVEEDERAGYTTAEKAAVEYAEVINAFYYALDIDCGRGILEHVGLEANLTQKFADLLLSGGYGDTRLSLVKAVDA